MNELEKLLSVAMQEKGYLEKKSNAQLDDKTANAGSGNYTKYARDFDKKYPTFYNGKKNGYEWCDIFVDWCFVTAFGEDRAKELLCQPSKSYGAGVGYSADYYKAKGQFHTSNPQAGDQIFFQNSKGVRTHTGLVINVDNKYVYTIEGNADNGVKEKKYVLGSSSIYGYGRPNYKIEEVKPETPKKLIEEIAKEVLAGKWGNGEERKTKITNAGYNYSEVQAKVNELSKGNNSWSKREYTVLKAKYVRTSPVVAANNKLKYARLNNAMQKICIKDTQGYAKFKVGAKVTISDFTTDNKGNIWGMRKGTNTDTWLCVQDSTGKQVK